MIAGRAVLIHRSANSVSGGQTGLIPPADVSLPSGSLGSVRVESDVPFTVVDDVSSDEEVILPRGLALKDGSQTSLDMLQLTAVEQEQLGEVMATFGLTKDPLCKLSFQEFLTVAPPPVSSMSLLECLIRREVTHEVRLEILDQQMHLWSDDEVRFHLQQILLKVDKHDVGFVDPLLAAEMIRHPRSSLLAQWVQSWDGILSSVVVVVWLTGHWVPLYCHWNDEVMQVVSCDNTNPQPRELTQFCDALSAAVGTGRFVLRVEHRRFDVDDFCGVCAVRYLDHLLRGKMLPTTRDEVIHLHNVGRSIFVSHLLARPFVSRPWIWGNGLDAQAKTRLGNLLSQHGVPDDQIETRIHLIVQSLGVSQVAGVLNSSSPWRSLKSVANAHRPTVQLVLPDELQAQVAKKMEQGAIGTKQKRKPPVKAPAVPLSLDPLKLAVDAGTFESSTGAPLRQIGVTQIGPIAEGVVVCNMATAGAFLRADQPVNHLALGLIVVDAVERDLPAKLKSEQLRVALRCAANGEPLLALVHLVQLGGVEVKQTKGKLASEIPAAEVTCIKASVYRDQLEGTWSEFCKSPIRYILAHLPLLRICDSCGAMATADCPFWHPEPDSGLTDPVLDVWRRQWLTLQFKQSAQDAAALFIVNLRIVMALEERVLRCSGRGGVFLEPRSVDARSPSMDYQVVWVPRADPAEIERLCQCNPLALGAARVGSRLGIRVRTADASALGQQLKPGSVYLASGVRVDYEVGPLPFGLDRVALSKMFGSWGWQARPLHPIRTLPGVAGAVWLVQACVDPPSNVVTLKHGEVVISKVGPKNAAADEMPVSVVTSSKTLELCQMKPASDSLPAADPWLIKDPWAQALVQLPHGADQAAAALKQVEARVEQTLMAKLPKLAAQDVDAQMTLEDHQQNEDRFQALEKQVQQLTQSQQTLEVKVEDTSRRQEAQLSQFQHQLSAHIEAQGTQMEQLFRKQMASIEDLLAVKARSRSRHE